MIKAGFHLEPKIPWASKEHGRIQDFFEGNTVRKFSKSFLRKLRKMHYFCIFFKKFKKPCVNFLRLWTKNTMYWKFWENFRKLLNMHYFSIFSKDFRNHAFIFRAFGRKHNLLEIFEKIFENFHKNIAKNAFFLHIFQKI